MSIVSLKKVTLCGLIAEKTSVLDKLQEQGKTHLISLGEKLKKDDELPVHDIGDALIALKYLQQCETQRHQVRQPEDFNFNQVVQQVLELKNKLVELREQREFLQERIKDVELWGDFNLADSGPLGAYKLWFYIVPKRLMKQVRKSELIWEQVNHSNTHAYIVVLAKEEPVAKAMPVPRTHTGDVSLSQLYKNLENVELDLEDAGARRESLTRWITLIMLNLAQYENSSALHAAHALTRDEDDVFVVQTWVDEENIAEIEQFARQHKLAWISNNPDGEEQPPTLLKNTNTFAGGEELVKFYQMPNYYDWDPSIVVFFSFALFFSMILSDAGYAAVFMGFLALKWQGMGKSAKGIRFRQLLLVTLTASLVWGVLVGSYFGMSPEAGMLVAKLKLFDINDFSTMMKISIFVGVIHVALANLVRAYQLHQQTTRFASIGWALFVIGGFILWLAKDSHSAMLEQSATIILSLSVVALLLLQ